MSSSDLAWCCGSDNLACWLAEIQEGLRYVFQTDSQHVLMTSGTGHAGMEACISNLVEPGEKVIVGNNGIWGARVCDLAARFRGRPWPG